MIMKCNPYLPYNEYIPDGEPHVFNGRLYIYGSHDAPGVNRFCVRDYAVWSCDINDLTEWRYEGISYTRTDDPHNLDDKHALFAPDVAKGEDGNYYLYYCLDFLQEIGVGRSDRPEGPFTFYGHIHYEDGTILHEYFPYDPSVLVDENGKVFLYYGFAAHFNDGSFGNIEPSPGCMVVELEKDMVTVKRRPVMCLPTDQNCHGTSFSPEHAYFEAPSARKYGDLYYLVYSSQSQHELCYATSIFPDRDFIYRGVLVSNGDIGLKGNEKAVNYIGTNHGGLCMIHNKFYVFYHRNTHGLATSRQGCAEQVFLKKNGDIDQVGITSYGLLGRPFEGMGTYSAYEACYLECLDTFPIMKIKKDYRDQEPFFCQTEENGEMFHYIANIKNRCLFGYNAFELKKNTSLTLTFRGNADGEILVAGDRSGNYLLGKIVIKPSNTWTEEGCDLHNESGIYKLYFMFTGKGTFDFLNLYLF